MFNLAPHASQSIAELNPAGPIHLWVVWVIPSTEGPNTAFESAFLILALNHQPGHLEMVPWQGLKEKKKKKRKKKKKNEVVIPNVVIYPMIVIREMHTIE